LVAPEVCCSLYSSQLPLLQVIIILVLTVKQINLRLSSTVDEDYSLLEYDAMLTDISEEIAAIILRIHPEETHKCVIHFLINV
jgi:hypothetical protein